MSLHARAGAFAVALSALSTGAQADVLYFDEFTFANDPIEQALTNLGLAFTEVTDEANFNAEITGHSYDLVIFLEESTTHSSARTNVQAYVAGGGKAIYNSYAPGSFASVFDASAGALNSVMVDITNPALAAGMGSASFDLVNPAFGVFSVELTPIAGGTSGGTLGGASAVVFGNGGRTIMNSFLTETFPVPADEVTFYENEISVLVNVAQVPLPAALPMAVGALGLLGFVGRRRIGA